MRRQSAELATYSIDSIWLRFDTSFVEDRDIAQPAVLERCLTALGLSGPELLQEA